MSVNFHIGKLTIEGGTRADGARVGEALRGRLTELAHRGLPIGPLSIDRLDAGTLPHGASAADTGRHLADRIFRSVRGTRDA
jgi:hypothetical protein